MFKITLLLVTLTVTGCATNSLIPQPITATDLNENNGILIGSFARDPAAHSYHSQTFQFKNISTGETYDIKSQPKVNILAIGTPDDFQTLESKGGIFIFSLPPGQYTFYNFRLFHSNGYVNKNWWSETDYSIPFKVSANTVNYIGEIKLIPITGENLFGLTMHSGGYWEISNQKKRDKRIIIKKYPFISMENSIDIIPNKMEVFTPWVILPPEGGRDSDSSKKDAESSTSF
ncbi:MAG: hypothetical protein P1U54_06260 [Immundisolibacteraceae bacterium]|nr:hypothetical protein [Immundisolibacteraceae bacterium]